MRRYERRDITRPSDVLVELTCDLCGAPPAKIDAVGNHYWSRNGAYEQRVEVSRSTPHYGEASGTVNEFDICPACWPKIVDWIGKAPRTWDF